MISSGPKLGVAGIDFVLVHVDRGEHVVFVPDARTRMIASSKLWPSHGHERDLEVLAESQFATGRSKDRLQEDVAPS